MEQSRRFDAWQVPGTVEVKDDVLLWSNYRAEHEVSRPEPLEAFLGLHDDETGERIAAFASYFGVLLGEPDDRQCAPVVIEGEDEHGNPESIAFTCSACDTATSRKNNSKRVARFEVVRQPPALGYGFGELLADRDLVSMGRAPFPHGAEPLSLWRDLANDFRVLLRIQEAVFEDLAPGQQSTAAPVEVWQQLRCLEDVEPTYPNDDQPPAAARRHFYPFTNGRW